MSWNRSSMSRLPKQALAGLASVLLTVGDTLALLTQSSTNVAALFGKPNSRGERPITLAGCFSLHWLSIGVSGLFAMVSKRRDGVRGSPVRSVRNEFWQERSPLMEGRNGFLNSGLNPMCGRGGVAGDATTTPSRAAGKVQAGSCSENWRLVNGLFIVEWRGRQEVQKSGGRDERASSAG